MQQPLSIVLLSAVFCIANVVRLVAGIVMSRRSKQAFFYSFYLLAYPQFFSSKEIINDAWGVRPSGTYGGPAMSQRSQSLNSTSFILAAFAFNPEGVRNNDHVT